MDRLIIVAAADKAAAQAVCNAAGDGPDNFLIALADKAKGLVTDPAQADFFAGSGGWYQATVDALQLEVGLNVHIYDIPEGYDPGQFLLDTMEACNPKLARVEIPI